MLRRLLLTALVLLVLAFAVAGGAAYWFFSRDGFRQALEGQASAWLGHPVRIGTARAQLLPRLAVQLGDVRVGDPVQLTLEDVEVAADLRPLLNWRIENADVLISGSRIDMPLPFGLPRGDGQTVSGDEEPTVRIVSVRSIALRDVRIRSRGREVTVSADSSLAGPVLTLERFTAESGATTLTATGTVTLSPRVDARLEAAADRVDLDEMIALANAFGSAVAADGASPQQPRIAASVSAGEATVGALRIRNFSTDLVSDDGSVALKPLRFELFDGRYEGALTARLGQQMSANLESQIADLDVAQLAAFGGASDTVTGRLSGSGSFSGTGADLAQLLRAARGNGTAMIVDGSIRRLHLVRTVILFFGRPAPEAGEGTDAFERLDVAFSLAERVVRANALSMQSEDADLTGAGTLNLDTEALEGRVNLILSEMLSAQAGTDLYRYTREGNRVVLPALVGGTLGMPVLTIDVAAAARRGLRNEVERRLKDLFGR